MRALPLLVLLPLVACAAPTPTFMASKRSAVELRAMETRLVPGGENDVMRGAIATLQDLGYRIDKVEGGAGTVSATRATQLRMAVVVRPNAPDECTVRANATVVAVNTETQVDSPAFYTQDFFVPLSGTLQRQLVALPAEVEAPEAARPVAELNTAKEREAAAKAAAPAATGSKAP